MKTIFEEYGTVIIVAIAIVALIAIVTFILGDDQIKGKFKDLVTNFFNQVKNRYLKQKQEIFVYRVFIHLRQYPVYQYV